MKKTRNRTLSLLLALVLAVSLAVPAGAANVPVTGVTLNKTSVTLVPKETVSLEATVLPENATKKTVTWKSNKTAVATVSSKGVVTAVAEGTADITATTSDGNYSAICKVTVEKDSVTGVTITPAGPETLPVGKTRQLEAKVTYAHGSERTQSVTWSTNNPAVATVSDQGLVTAVSAGTAEIFALYKGEDNVSVMQSYRLTVTKDAASSANDVLVLSSSTITANGGLYVDTHLQAPKVTVMNGTSEVTDAYEITYRWTDSAKKEIGTGATVTIQPIVLADLVLTCTVTATSKTDSTQILTGVCGYGVKVYPGTTVGAVLTPDQGTLSLGKLMNQEGNLSLLDQLLQGDGTDFAPAISGLTHVIFDLSSATGTAAGTRSAKDQTSYYLTSQSGGALLSDVTFTPLQEGTYSVGFLAYGEKIYYGRLEIIVASQSEAPPVTDGRQCDATGFTFAGTDFFHSGDADPVATIVFGSPTGGKLLRDLAGGSGIPDQGARYYTNSASKGEFHVSTLSYLPHAGFTGYDTIPVTLTTQSGKVTTASLSVYVTGKTHSEHFTDVTEANVGTWAADAVDFGYHFGLVNGMEPTLFYPNSTMTRAQLVTILYRASGSPELAVTTNFEDLDVGSYYYNAVVWANVTGVVTGTSDTTFSPNALITREQIATILYRYAQTTGGDTTSAATALSGYADKGSISLWATDAMTWAVSHGILTGTTDTTLSPLASATRAQVVVMLHRYLAG